MTADLGDATALISVGSLLLRGSVVRDGCVTHEDSSLILKMIAWLLKHAADNSV
jgi:hypothetical protein